MSRKTFCDFCGKEVDWIETARIDQKGFLIEIEEKRRVRLFVMDRGWKSVDSFDMCGECVGKIVGKVRKKLTTTDPSVPEKQNEVSGL